MSAGARTIRPLETLIGPKVLPPPPTRHALFAFLVALAAILHFASAGWSEIHNGAEGFYAGGARQMLDSGNFAGATLLHWLILASYKLCGVSPAAARFPIALALTASIALTFLIGERLRDYWRGFVAGLIHLCLLGSFIWGRIVTPQPVFTAFLEAAIFCAICGYQQQQTRARCFAGVALFVALACMAIGLIALCYAALIFVLLGLIFREARMRFAQLLRWPNIVIFIALVVPWQVCNHAFARGEGVPVLPFVGLHAAWWFPALLLVLPGICFGSRKVFRPHEFDFADALPLCWMLVGFIPILFMPHRQDFSSMAMWPAFALFAANAWDRTSPRLRLAGISLIALVGVALVCSATVDISKLLRLSNATGWPTMLVVAGAALIVSSALCVYFTVHHRDVVAVGVLMLGMVPVGLSAADAMARLGPYFSLAAATEVLSDSGEVLYEGRASAASSLEFYLSKPVVLADETVVLQKFSQPHPVYLIMRKERVPFWQERLTERFHIYHQETICGPHVVVSNQP